MRFRSVFFLLNVITLSMLLVMTGCDKKINTIPTAILSASATGTVGTPIFLDASQSYDPEGDSLRYFWALSLVPEGSTAVLQNPRAAETTLVPDLPGYYVVILYVNDGKKDSPAVIQTIQVIGSGIERPYAEINDFFLMNAEPGLPLELNGEPSVSVNGDLSYVWSIVVRPNGSTAEIIDAQSSIATFTPDQYGEYIVKLEVQDDNHISSAAVAKFTVDEPFRDIKYQVNGTSVTFTWKTILPTTAILRYYLGTVSGEVTDSHMSREHTITLTELEPNMTYNCELISEDENGYQNIAKQIRSFITESTPTGIFTDPDLPQWIAQ